MSFKIRIRNFQSIEDATLLIDGFTVITGPNNLGKSAVVRALKGIFTNPAPSFVRHGASHATVELWQGGAYVRWEKGPKTNAYYLTVNGVDQTFEKPGAMTPPEVLKAFRVAPIQVSNTSVWPQFSDALSGPVFLLDRPGSALAEVVADVERIQVLSKALKNSESEKRQIASTLKVRKTDQKKIAEQLEHLAPLDLIIAKFSSIEEKHSQISRMGSAYEKLQELKIRLVEAREAVDRLQGFDEAAGSLPQSSSLTQASRLRDGIRTLDELRVKLRKAREECQALQGFQEAAQTLPSVEGVREAELLRAELLQLQEVRVRLDASNRDAAFFSGFSGLQLPSEDLFTKARSLRESLQDLSSVKSSLNQARTEVKTWANLPEISWDEKPFQMAKQLRSALTLMIGIRDQIHKSQDQVNQASLELAKKLQEMEALEARLGAVLAEYEACPLCGQKT